MTTIYGHNEAEQRLKAMLNQKAADGVEYPSATNNRGQGGKEMGRERHARGDMVGRDDEEGSHGGNMHRHKRHRHSHGEGVASGLPSQGGSHRASNFRSSSEMPAEGGHHMKPMSGYLKRPMARHNHAHGEDVHMSRSKLRHEGKEHMKEARELKHMERKLSHEGKMHKKDSRERHSDGDMIGREHHNFGSFVRGIGRGIKRGATTIGKNVGHALAPVGRGIKSGVDEASHGVMGGLRAGAQGVNQAAQNAGQQFSNAARGAGQNFAQNLNQGTSNMGGGSGGVNPGMAEEGAMMLRGGGRARRRHHHDGCDY